MKRIFAVFFTFALLTSCNQPIQEKKEIKEPTIVTPTPAPNETTETIQKKSINNNRNYQGIDSLILEDLKILDSIYESAPFYTLVHNSKFFIVSSDKYNYKKDRFSGQIKYGVVNDSLELILKLEYDKIFNPDMTMKNCFEIRKDGLHGLFNYENQEILEPQFEYIIPQNDTTSYGLKNGEWFQIEASNLSFVTPSKFNPKDVLTSLSFDIAHIGDRKFFDSYYSEKDGYVTDAKIKFIAPSYLNHLDFYNKYDEIISIRKDRYKDQGEGVDESSIKTTDEYSLTDKLTSFFISFYESGISGREYYSGSTKMALYNKERETINTIDVENTFRSGSPCHGSGYQLIGDSLLQISTERNRNDEPSLYDVEGSYRYYRISENGEFTHLESNRYFDFTKYVIINSSYFQPCLYRFMKSSEQYDHFNMWTYDHYTIEELDIMRNEIFADYGYRFKTQKWMDYFERKPWYEAKYDNVDDQLTEIDKANIKTILQAKERMQGKEDEIVNKQPRHYVAAG